MCVCVTSLSCFKQQWLAKVSSHRWDFLKHEHKVTRRCRSVVPSLTTSFTACWEIIVFFVHWHLKHGAYCIFNSKWLKLLQAIPTGLFVEAMTCSCCWNCQRDSWWNFCRLQAVLLVSPPYNETCFSYLSCPHWFFHHRTAETTSDSSSQIFLNKGLQLPPKLLHS